MKESTKKANFLYILNNFESYISMGIFLFMTVFLTIQVISRYCFGYSLAWAEELATILFVPMIYCSISAAVTSRKHITISALQDVMPFRVRKVMLIVSNLIFLAFCLYVQKPLIELIIDLGNSTSAILGISKRLCYICIPLLFVLTSVRILQDTVRLAKENEQNLNKKSPTLDLDACEREAEERARIRAAQVQTEPTQN